MDIQQQLQKLREEWLKAPRDKREIIEVRGKLLKKALESKQLVETFKKVFGINKREQV